MRLSDHSCVRGTYDLDLPVFWNIWNDDDDGEEDDDGMIHMCTQLNTQQRIHTLSPNKNITTPIQFTTP